MTDELREAARLMRERACSATDSLWLADAGSYVNTPDDEADSICDTWGRQNNAAHIASWHPDVALAVADWMDYQAKTLEHNISEGSRPPGCHPTHPAFAVARAYLLDASAHDFLDGPAVGPGAEDGPTVAVEDAGAVSGFAGFEVGE